MLVTTEVTQINPSLRIQLKSRYFLGAVAVVVLAFILRLFRIDYLGLSGDEPSTVSFSQLSIQDLLKASGNTGYPPFHYLLMHYWMEIFGKSEVSIRVPSLVAGTLLVALMIFMGTRMFNEGVGILAGILAAGSPMLLHFSQEARAYSILGLVSMLSTWCLWYAVHNKNWLAWAAYSLSVAALLYIHYAIVFLLAAQGFFCLVQAREKPAILARFVVSMMGALLLFSPWLPFFLVGPSKAGSELGFSMDSYWSVVVSFISGETNAEWGIRDILAGVLGFVLLGVSVYTFFRSGKPRAAQLLVSSLGISLILMIPISVNFSMPRHFSYLLPIFLLLVAWGIRGLASWKTQGIILTLIAVSLIISLPRFYAGQRITVQHWREFIQALSPLDSTTLILVAPGFYKDRFDYYYHGTAYIQALPRESDPRTDKEGENLITTGQLNKYNDLLDKYHHIIVVGAQREAVDPNHEIEAWLNARSWTEWPGTQLTQDYPGLQVEEFNR